MKKAVQILILFGMLSGASEAQETKSGAGRKDMYVFIVAASESGDPKQNSLKYADDDAALYYEFFKPVAKKANIFTVFDGESRGIFAEMANEALPPRKDIVLSEFRKMREEIRANGDANSALFIVLIGHGGIDEKGEGYLNLMGGRLARGEIKKEMIASAGDLVETTLIIDTCNAYFLVKSRDEWKFHDTGADLTEKFDEFLFNFERKNEFPILGLIVSTAGARETFEWEYLKAGVFSHVVRSGLHGGADINQDKKVTYSELRAFIASVTGGVKNEKAKIKYFIEAPSGYDDKVIVDLSAWEEKGADLLVLSKEGRYFLEDNRGVRVFDLNAGSGAVFPLLLPKKLAYYLNLNGLETKINTPAGWEKGIDNLAFAESAAAKRGIISESLLEGLFSSPYSKDFYDGYVSGFKGGSLVLTEGSVPQPKKSPLKLGAAYTLSKANFDIDGIEHGASLKLVIPLGKTFYLTPEAGFGYSTYTKIKDDYNLYRISTIIGFGAEIPLSARTYIFSEIGAGHQWNLRSGEGEVKGDALGLRGKFEAGFAYKLFGWLALKGGGGIGFNVVTLDGSEEIFYQPYFSFGGEHAF